MGKDVQNLLKEILGEDGFKKLETEKRLIKELW
jgi:sulfite reductase alpha subunit-like flavoprotein